MDKSAVANSSDPAPYSQTISSHRESVSEADCGEGLQSGFLPLPQLHCSQPLWTTSSARDHGSSRHFPPPFSKWMMKSKLSGLFHANLKENLGKRFQSCFPRPQFSANDRFRSYCSLFCFQTTGKGIRRNPYNTYFHCRARAARRAAPGSMPSYWPVRDGILVPTVAPEVCTG